LIWFPFRRNNWRGDSWPAAGLDICGAGRKRTSTARWALSYAKWLDWVWKQRQRLLWFLGIFGIIPVVLFLYILWGNLG